jgi:hypothetical protein
LFIPSLASFCNTFRPSLFTFVKDLSVLSLDFHLKFFAFVNTLGSSINITTLMQELGFCIFAINLTQQALLLADSGLIVVLCERGELVLLRANPDRLEELAKLPALTGKSWNHPVVVGNRLYLRNAEEAVCYELQSKPDAMAASASDSPRVARRGL